MTQDAGMRDTRYVFRRMKCGLATGNNSHTFLILLTNGKSSNAIHCGYSVPFPAAKYNFAYNNPTYVHCQLKRFPYNVHDIII